jgi:hypothetical protein
MAGDGLFPHPFQEVPFNPKRHRELVRGGVALAVIFIFLLVVAFYLYESSSANDTLWKQVKEAMQSVLPAVTSVLGTVLGFYFGSKKH